MVGTRGRVAIGGKRTPEKKVPTKAAAATKTKNKVTAIKSLGTIKKKPDQEEDNNDDDISRFVQLIASSS